MDDVDGFIHSILRHANSRIYDPVKAHAYYERTKDLKGRRSASGLKTKKRKEGWNYVQAKVKEAKKSELESASGQNKEVVAQLRATGGQRRKALSEKIKALMQQVTSDTKTRIEALPKNLSKEDRAIKVAEIREETFERRESTKSVSKGEREQLVTELKSTIDSARDNYKQIKERIKVKWENKLQSEYDALKTTN